jgi:glycosyltransferase involved in cell wall biosynthesis
MNPRVSILLPVYNGQQHLAECVRSVLAQSMGEWELLVGDDASTDASFQILNQFSESRIRLFRRSTNLGLFPNENKLLMEARAPLIRFLCQDDVMEPDCLAQETHYFDEHPEIGMSFCKTTRIDACGSEIGKCRLHDLPDMIPPMLSLQLLFYFGCIPGNLSTVSVRKKCIENCDPFDPSFGVSADYELWTRICRKYDMGVIHQHLIRLRHHGGQLSRRDASAIECMAANRRIRATLFSELPKQVRRSAGRFMRCRHDVLDVHHAFRQLPYGWKGLKTFGQVVRILGPMKFLLGTVLWLLTFDNRLYKPSPIFVN